MRVPVLSRLYVEVHVLDFGPSCLVDVYYYWRLHLRV